jgi:hypothetical protein
VSGLKKKLARSLNSSVALASLDAVADAFARDDLDRGAALLGAFLAELPAAAVGPQRLSVLRECAARLAESKAERWEYVLLALVALHISADQGAA